MRVFQTFYDLSEGTGRRFNTHMAGDDSGLGVCCQRHDSVSGLSQDGAGFLTTQDPLREEESLKPSTSRRDLFEVEKEHCCRWKVEKYFLKQPHR